MSNKFEEVLFLFKENKRLYSIEDITTIRQNNIRLFCQMKNYLFCPECETPHLVYRHCENKSDYFATVSHEDRLRHCSFSCDKATHKMIETIYVKPDLIKINNRSERCLDLFVDGISDSEQINPVVIDNERDKSFLEKCSSAPKDKRKDYYIPRKRLTAFLNEKCTETHMIYYGKAFVKWFDIKDKYHPHRMCIYHIENKRLICSLDFSNNVCSYLPISIKPTATIEEFKCSIAFYTKMNSRYDENSSVVGNTFYSSIITNSRLISVRDIVPIK